MNGFELMNNHNLLVSLSGKKLPVRLSFAITVNIETMEKRVRQLDAMRLKLLASYANKDAAGEPVIKDGNYSLDEDALAQFQKEYGDLMQEQNDVPIKTITRDVIEAVDASDRYDALTPAEIIGMRFMIKDFDEE